MAILEKRTFENGSILGSWRIEEDLEDLSSKLILEPEEEEKINSFKSYNRKLEYMSVRVLLNTLLERRALIVYDETNKPFLKDNSYQISISHSGQITSILLSRSRRVGIDLEKMSHRISGIAHKFINKKESITEDPWQKRYHLYIHWCAKEALYKICDKGGLNFREDMIIEKFQPADQGKLKGIVIRDNKEHYFDLEYYRSDNYVTVMCTKEFDNDFKWTELPDKGA